MIREFAVRLFILVTPEAISVESHKHLLSKHEVNKDNTKEHAKVDREKPISCHYDTSS